MRDSPTQLFAATLLTLWTSVASSQDQLAEYSNPEPGEKVLAFYSKMPEQAVAVTHSGHVGLGFFPADIPKFTEPGIRTGSYCQPQAGGRQRPGDWLCQRARIVP
jgi:hypothetical protein